MPSTPDHWLYWIGLSTVVMMASAGVPEAGRKRYHLFGITVVALAAALGGGALRSLLLDRHVFWVADQTYLVVAFAAAFVNFFLALVFVLPPRLFLIPDAAGLALFWHASAAPSRPNRGAKRAVRARL